MEDNSGLRPVTIALDSVSVGKTTNFTGIDLDTGRRMSVLILDAPVGGEPPTHQVLSSEGLVLSISLTAAGGRQ